MVVLVYNKTAKAHRERRDSGSVPSSAEASRDAQTPIAPAAVVAFDEETAPSVTAVASDGEDSDPTHLSDHLMSCSAADDFEVSEGLPTVETTAAGTTVDTAERSDAGTGEVSAERSLVRAAEVGAVQQLACRDTMLTLKEAFEGALSIQARMEAQKQQDRQRLAELQARHKADQKRLAELLEQLEGGSKVWDQLNKARRRIAELQAEIEEYRQKEDGEKLKMWTNRLLNNKGSFNFVMMLSREAHPLGALSKAEFSSPDPPSVGSLLQDSESSAGGLQEPSDRAHFYEPSGSGLADASSSSDALASSAQPGLITGSTATRSSAQAQGDAACFGQSVDNAAEPFKTELQQGKHSLVQQQALNVGLASIGSKDKPSPSSGRHQSDAKQLQASSPSLPVASTATAQAKASELTTGDHLTLRWVLKLWSHHIHSNAFVRNADKGVNCDICLTPSPPPPTPPPPRHVEHHGSQTDGGNFDAERQALLDQILDLKHDLQQEEKARLLAVQERDALSSHLAEVNAKHSAEKDQLLNEILKIQRESQMQMAQKDLELNQLQQKLESQRQAMQRAEAAWENEKRALKATIRDITSDLQQALTQARRMELLLEKLKKEGGAAGLRDRLAQLIADLQAAKNKLAVAGKERDQAVEKSELLHHKLGSATRKMELERQFLPLIHLARGPVGEPKALNKTSNSKSEPKLPHRGQPQMLQ